MVARKAAPSEAFGQIEDVRGDVAEDEVGRDRRDLVEPGLAELALDVVVLGEPEAAVVWTATLAASHEASAASSFAMFASLPQGSPRSNISAALIRIRSAASTLTCARAMGNWTP